MKEKGYYQNWYQCFPNTKHWTNKLRRAAMHTGTASKDSRPSSWKKSDIDGWLWGRILLDRVSVRTSTTRYRHFLSQIHSTTWWSNHHAQRESLATASNWTGSGDGCDISLQQTWNWDQDVFIGGRWIKVLDRTLQWCRRHSAFSNVQCLWNDKAITLSVSPRTEPGSKFFETEFRKLLLVWNMCGKQVTGHRREWRLFHVTKQEFEKRTEPFTTLFWCLISKVSAIQLPRGLSDNEKIVWPKVQTTFDSIIASTSMEEFVTWGQSQDTPGTERIDPQLWSSIRILYNLTQLIYHVG